MRGGDIKKIDTLLQKYKQNIRAPQESVVRAFKKVVSDELGITLPKESIRYTVSSRTIAVGISGPRKSEIMLHKGKLLAACTAALGEKNAPHHIV